MNSRKILFDVLSGTGLDDSTATKLSTLQPQPGGSWTNEVLNSGCVDEIKFAAELGRAFQTAFETVEIDRIERKSLTLLPSRFVFKHQVLPLGGSETAVRVATYD